MTSGGPFQAMQDPHTGGFCVALVRQPLAVSLHFDLHTAEQEAERLNARAMAALRPTAHEPAPQHRRTVRYFPDEG